MKNFVALFALFVSTASFAGQTATLEGFTSVSCRDARNMADAGIMVAITQYGGMQYLELSEQTFMGPRKLGVTPVRQAINKRGGQATYVGQGVQLTITTDSARRPDLLRSGEMEGFIRGVVGQARLDHDLRCQIFARAL